MVLEGFEFLHFTKSNNNKHPKMCRNCQKNFLHHFYFLLSLFNLFRVLRFKGKLNLFNFIKNIFHFLNIQTGQLLSILIFSLSPTQFKPIFLSRLFLIVQWHF
ncbi:unnamed protein product [Meloidogyne enterolobii]|uniref:Uncharacterized protein n=1 Tax=Meloidogyne enterolobii TaxID=390850 RepID=A0ACB1AC71_MELEN